MQKKMVDMMWSSQEIVHGEEISTLWKGTQHKEKYRQDDKTYMYEKKLEH